MLKIQENNSPAKANSFRNICLVFLAYPDKHLFINKQ